jgi:lipoprotein-anchoring transpeptidase ErfK/SrfK
MYFLLKKRDFIGFLILLLATLLLFGPFLVQYVHAQAGRTAMLVGASPKRSTTGEVIVVNLSQQWLYAYKNGQKVFDTPVTTGRPGLGTPTGTYHIFVKFSSVMFHSSFPRKSPNWYPPTRIEYALEWKPGGYFLHASSWQSVYGPGTNDQHYDPVDGWETGSHGCVEMPTDAATWLYHWAQIGTEVHIVS